MLDSTKLLISKVSQDAIKAWLKSKDLKSSFLNKDQFISLLDEHIVNKTITEEELQLICIKIEEYSNQTIYFFNSQITHKNELEFKKYIHELKHKYSEKALTTLYNPPSISLNYASYDIDSNEIYVKFSEKHVKLIFNANTRGYDYIDVTKINIISQNLTTGVVSLRLNSPERIHSHTVNNKINKAAYIDYYKSKAMILFKIKKLEKFDLYPAIESLSKSKELFKMSSSKVSGDEAKGKITSNGTKIDLRDTPIYLSLKKQNEDLIETNLKGEILQSLKNDLKIYRDIYISLDGKERCINFKSHCLPSEINYVLSFTK